MAQVFQIDLDVSGILESSSISEFSELSELLMCVSELSESLMNISKAFRFFEIVNKYFRKLQKRDLRLKFLKFSNRFKKF